MKKKIIMGLIVIIIGILCVVILNNKIIYAKEEYNIYVIQTGVFKKIENAVKYRDNLPSGVIIQDNDLYRVYSYLGINNELLKNIYNSFKLANIDTYIKVVGVSKEFYSKIEGYEKILIKTDDETVINKINQNLLEEYLKEINNE